MSIGNDEVGYIYAISINELTLESFKILPKK